MHKVFNKILSRIYKPVVVIAALTLSLIPNQESGAVGKGKEEGECKKKMLSVSHTKQCNTMYKYTEQSKSLLEEWLYIGDD